MRTFITNTTREKTAPGFRAQLLSMAVLLLALNVAFGQQAPDRSSPRATFASFLENMVAYGKEQSGESGRQYLELATSCLDLSSVPSSLRPDVGPKLARDLKNFLDKYEMVVIDELPEKWDSDYFLWRKPIADGEISLARDSMGTWRFSTATIESLPALLDFVKDKNVVEGVEATVQPASFTDWLRKKLPPSLTDRALLLENWQWLALLIIVFIGLIIERVVNVILSYWIGKLLMKTHTRVKFKVESHVIRPAGFLVMAVFWSLMLPALDLPLRALEALLFATQIIMAASGVWAAYRVVDIGAAYFGSLAEKTESKFDDLLVPMVRRSLKILVGAFGLLFIADNMDIDITSLLAGLGIGGVALALAAKDTVENLFGSVTVLIDRPFEIGD
ncbi:MAG: mechanosensitive ion channel, partial [Chlorobi bacterium]|nr:mechanosensitive ion channel [Chlorobiota bacterium]